ncbi:tetratricopeptide repeat protein [Limibacter armeniacum]|uniref:tetratricopeptide repeat protein n=1 Tax=Limibacter armeniacum TaxID=466084 RepID=UPI002FE61E34
MRLTSTVVYNSCKIIFILFVLLTTISVNNGFTQDQHKVDSLLLLVEHHEADTVKVRLLSELTDYYSRYDLGVAEKYAYQSLKVAENISSEYTAPILKKLGIIQFQKGLFVDATKSFLDALAILEAEGDVMGQLSIKNNIGLVYERQLKFDIAIKYLLEVVEETQASTLPEKVKLKILSSAYLNLGASYAGLEKLDEALSYYKAVLNIKEAPNGDYNCARALNNIGKLYKLKNDGESAFQYHKKALVAKEKINDKIGMISTLLELADHNLSNNQIKEAKEYLDKALEVGKVVNSPILFKSIYRCYYVYYKQVGKTDLALEYHEKLLEYSEMVSKNETEERIDTLWNNYEQEKERREAEIKRKEEQMQMLMIVLFLIAFGVVAALLFVLQRSKTKQALLKKEKLRLQNENLSNELEFRNKELTANVMNLVQKNELINDVTKKLIDLKTNMKKDNQSTVRQIVFDLHTSSSDDLWAEFEMRFQNVHSDFYRKLNERFPDLTPNERKLCAFLRLNMSSKEISSVTRQSIKSIEMGRFRLRKKLGISNSDQNLNTFIEQL